MSSRIPSWAISLLVTAVFFAAVAAGSSTDTSPRPLGLFPDLADGETVGQQLRDGTPVYVHRDGDERVVLGAISPLGVLLVWCGDVQGFIEPGTAFSYDAHGRYVFGGFPHGAFRYASELRGDQIVVTHELPPAPRYEFGAFANRRPNGNACHESEGAVGGLYHPVAKDPDPVDQVRFDGSWQAVTGLLDMTAAVSTVCARPTAQRCPGDGRDSVPVASTYMLRSPAMTRTLTGRYDGVFIARAAPGGALHDVAIVQRLLDVEAAREGEWLYQTRSIFEDEDVAAPNPPNSYVVGELQSFTRATDGGYDVTFSSANFTAAESGDLASTPEDAQPAPAHWRVSDRIDLVGIFDDSEGGGQWLISPEELIERAPRERLFLAGRIDDGGGGELVDLHVQRHISQ